MPFTPAHTAAILPLRGTPLPLAAAGVLVPVLRTSARRERAADDAVVAARPRQPA